MDFERLYEAYYMSVYSYLLTQCADAPLAEELTQQTFYKAMRAGSQSAYRGGAKELTWLCAIGKNLLRDELRERKRISELPEDMQAFDDSFERMEREQLTLWVHRVLHSMEEPYKEVFQLRVFGELSFRAIGDLFGKTENWARVTYHRAKLKIQERMDSHESKL